MKIEALGPEHIVQILPKAPQSILPKSQQIMNNLMETINDIRSFQLQLKMQTILGRSGQIEYAEDYSNFLQFGNKAIEAVAKDVIGVKSTDSNDIKMEKIRNWVQDNITYVSDLENYGRPERFALPTETLDRMSGDCEDGAFLIHSLALNSGIPWERLKTYGGLVYTGAGAEEGGHAWTTYQRETDNEWVVVDWCYFPVRDSIAKLVPQREDLKYMDDWFSVDAMGTSDWTFANSLRGSRINITV